MATQNSNPFGGATGGSSGGMFGGGMWGGGGGYGMPQQQSPYGGGYGGYGGMQSPYGGGYGGFGGGMPYGGGYGAPSPYGAPGGYGGYPQQSPYGGYSPYGMPSQYGPQPSYGMPQQQTMMASGAAPQTMAATQEGAGDAGGDATASGDTVSPAITADEAMRNLNIGGSTTQTNRFDPWGPQQEQLRRYLTGSTGVLKDPEHPEKGLQDVSGVGMPTTGAMGELYKQQQLGPLGFDPQSEAALQRMQALSTGANPLVDSATGATQGIASGQYNIGTGGMFSNLYANPGIQNLGQYQDMYSNPNIGGIDQYGRMAGQNAVGNAQQYQDIYNNPGITGVDQYGRMAGQNAVGNADQYGQMIGRDAIGNAGDYSRIGASSVSPDQYNRLYNTPGIDQNAYRQMFNTDPTLTGAMNAFAGYNGVGTGNYGDILDSSSGEGSLAGGMFGEVARGDRVNSNPYREQAIQDAMDQTSDEVKATMSSRGRFGSDAYGDAMGRALGQVATQARMQGYDTDTQNMMAAAQARSGEGLARQGVGLQAAGGIAGAEGANVASRMGAIQSVMNAGTSNYGQRLQALQGLTGAQQAIGGQQLAAAGGAAGIGQANLANQLAAAQGLSGVQGQNAQQRLAQIQGLSGIQGTNYQGQLSALGGMNAAQQQAMANRMGAMTGLSGIQSQNYQGQLNSLGQMNAAQQMQNQQRMAAAQNITAGQGQNWQNQLGAANALTGVNSQDLQNRMAAAGMAPAMQGLRYDDINRQLQAGATREAMAQQQRNYGWDTLRQFQGLVGGVPGSAGTSKGTEQKPWWETALGLGATAAGMWGQSTTPPPAGLF
jgi:hypothetical protein